MEEKQIQSFVHRVAQDEVLRDEFTRSPEEVSMREGFSPRVARILQQIVPQLALVTEIEMVPSSNGWA